MWLQDFTLYPCFQSIQTTFSDFYSQKFTHRNIKLLNSLGQVHVSDKGATLIVNPIQASILLHFNENSSTTLVTFILKGISESDLQKQIEPLTKDVLELSS